MAISHDLYAFYLDQLIAILTPNVALIDKDQGGYSTLRLNALKLFEENPNLRVLLDEYGGWDRSAIEAQIPANQPNGPKDIAFWILFLILSQMIRINTSAFKPLYIAQSFHWDTAFINLLSKGRPFKELAQRRIYAKDDNSSGAIPTYWDYVHPVSTVGTLGWLSTEDVAELLSKLTNVSETLPTSVTVENREEFRTVVSSTRDKLSLIHNQGMCIGIVVSG